MYECEKEFIENMVGTWLYMSLCTKIVIITLIFIITLLALPDFYVGFLFF